MKWLLLVILVGTCLVAAYDLQWTDAEGDEYGLYPSQLASSSTGLFDIVEFRVNDESEDDSTTFTFTLAHLDDPWEAPLGFSAALVQCYIHTAPLGSWRVQQEGSSNVISNPGIGISPLYKWVAMLEISGWGLCIVDTAGMRVCGLSGGVEDNRVWVDVPSDIMGTPDTVWSYTVLVGAARPPVDDAREAVLFFDRWADEESFEPNIMDILQPPGAALSQDAVLNNYCTAAQLFAVVEPVSLQQPPYVEGSSSPTPLIPGGNGCIDSPSTNVTARYDVVETLTDTAGELSLRLALVAPGLPELGPDVEELRVTIDRSHQFAVRMTVDTMDGGWSPPDVLQTPWAPESESDSSYVVVVTDSPFSIKISRPSGEVLFDTASTGSMQYPNLVFKDRYVETTIKSPSSDQLFGLGERVGSFAVEREQTYAMFNIDRGTPEDRNLYGIHPFLMAVREGQAHGVFLLNSYGSEVSVNADAVTFKALGGALDFFVFAGPDPEGVVQQYQNAIGRPALPPLWALGAHQCRWGYENVEELREVVDGYKANGIPLDTMWSDIDYMDDKKLFTLDPVNYSSNDLSQFVSELHDAQQHYVIIVDPGVRVENGYSVYDAGMERNAFIMNANGTDPALGKVWPGPVAFVDFMAPDAHLFWAEQVFAFHREVPFDGLWIDMNEIANFCDGHCAMDVTSVGDWATLFDCPCDVVEFHDEDFPPYWVGGMPPGTSTISMASRHYDGLLEEQVHSLYGHEEAIATAATLQELTGERSLVITRSSFAGTGHYAGHWLGDNTATWDDLRWSITGMMSMNMFGVPLTGADICGFNGNTTEELCARWYQVGSWYPFCRNHNVIGALSQEPYALGSTVLEVARTALLQRYQLIPTFYRWFVEVASNGGTVIRPLFFEFNADAESYAVEDQFMLGSSIMVAPVVYEGVLERNVYFPSPALWYHLWSGEPIDLPEDGWVLFDGVSISDTFSFIRGGSVLALREPALSVAELSTQPLSWVVALDPEVNSTGTLFLDDGVSLDAPQSRWDFMAVAHAEGHSYGKMYVDQVSDDFQVDEDLRWTSLSVYGVEGPCDLVIVSTSEWEYYFWPDSGLDYSEDSQVLRVTGLNVSLSEPHVEITWGKSAEPPSWTFRIIAIVSMTVVVVAFLCLVAVGWHLGTKYLPGTALYKRMFGSSSHHYTAATSEDDASEVDNDLFAIDDCEEEGEEMQIIESEVDMDEAE